MENENKDLSLEDIDTLLKDKKESREKISSEIEYVDFVENITD
mgnify:CR=1 FL=1